MAQEPNLSWNNLALCYDFDTGDVFGSIQPHTNYHGLCGLMHCDLKLNAVRPGKSLLNAEYYLRPGSGQEMHPRKLSLGQAVKHRISDGAVVLEFPDEVEYGLALRLAYTPHGDSVDLTSEIQPSRAVPSFDLFYASYVAEAFDETWMLLANPDGSASLVSLDNRGSPNACFGAARDNSTRARLDDGRYGEPMTRNPSWHLESRPFSRPVLVARMSGTGMSLVFLCDPDQTNLLGGQYHVWDTAHDWAYGTDLVPGKQVVTRTRMVFRHFGSEAALSSGLEDLWQDFVDG